MYYVGFSSATIVASLILFQGFNTHDATNTVSLLTGFVVTFLGVHILNLSRAPEVVASGSLENGILNPRLSLQGRLSIDGWHGIVEGREDVPRTPRTPRTPVHGRRSSGTYRTQGSTLFNAYDANDDVVPTDNVHLEQLREEDESDDDADEHTRLHSGGRHPGTGRSPGGRLSGRTMT